MDNQTVVEKKEIPIACKADVVVAAGVMHRPLHVDEAGRGNRGRPCDPAGNNRASSIYQGTPGVRPDKHMTPTATLPFNTEHCRYETIGPFSAHLGMLRINVHFLKEIFQSVPRRFAERSV